MIIKEKYRPICLLNVVFKIFAKILVNILIVIIKGVVRASQTAFLKGRYISEGVLVLHETLNSLHKKKKNQKSFLRLTLKKSLTKLNGPFFFKLLK